MAGERGAQALWATDGLPLLEELSFIQIVEKSIKEL